MIGKHLIFSFPYSYEPSSQDNIVAIFILFLKFIVHFLLAYASFYNPIDIVIYSLNILHGCFSWNGRGVGFLRYFQFKQLPNFLLASPILSLALFSIVQYAKSKPKLLFSVGFQATAEDRNFAAMLYFPERVSRSSIPHHAVASSSRIQGIAS